MPAEPLLRVAGLSKSFAGHPACRDVTFTLEAGRTLGLVGVSGSGKSTLARCIAGFETPDAGAILLEGRPAGTRPGEIQLIFQEAAASLNPRFTAAEIIAEPLIIQGIGTPASRRKAAGEWMDAVGLPPGAADRPAHAFSGGERQRLAIARALAIRPKLLILDESFSGLDILLQAQMADLLLDLRRRLALTCILVAHDIALACRIASELAVMHAGRIVEHAPTAELLSHPRHAPTRDLLQASRILALEDVS